MRDLLSTVRYTLRQFRKSPVFTTAAILTLALGIGGTTAIFTMIHAVMLRSLPVSDPALLYRIGDGDDCCVKGVPQDRWGMFSYPLYERLKEAAPEFEEVAAFKAGSQRVSVRREGTGTVAKPLRSEYVTGNYFSTLGVKPFGGRLLTPDDDRPSAPPVAIMSHHTWQAEYGGDRSVVGSTFVVEGHPFTVIGVTPPGFFGETLRGDPPDIWIPVQQEPLLAGDGALLRQSVAAWLRVIGRLRPGASTAGMSPRLTGGSAAMDATRLRLSRRLDARRHASAAQTGDQRGSGRRGSRRDEGRVRPQFTDPVRGLRHGAVDRLCQCREPAAGARGGTPRPNRSSHGDWSRQAADCRAGPG